ncbi:ribbon-helix-helix protein, CopG family [Dietzia sp. CQ4]|uniref:ribbon-helix-helix protein, CopG family n=1 Tax=Dietzia sp. (strain CQ4) TaxID=370437 RepID=UPI001F5075F7|nr:ribbon-helix-helix protein, CopG family [Dietzia sp. CQ4]
MTGPREGLGRAFAAPRSTETHPPVPAAKSDSIATSVRLESRSAERLKHYRDTVGWTTGEVIIDALEHTIDSLPTLLYPDGAIGGTLFARRGTSGSSATPTSKTPVYLRLQAEDYAVLDGLVETTGARSRTHLIETALTAYLDQKDRHDGTHQEDA